MRFVRPFASQLTIDESRCQVFVAAAAPPASLFFPDALQRSDEDNEAIMAAEAVSEILNAPSRPNVSVYNPFSTSKEQRDDKMSSLSVLSIFTGEDERFAYVSHRSIICAKAETGRFAPGRNDNLADVRSRGMASARTPRLGDFSRHIRFARQAHLLGWRGRLCAGSRLFGAAAWAPR